MFDHKDFAPYSHCHKCGTQYESDAWPRTCVACSFMVWRPIHPVAVLIQPVRGLLATDQVGVVLGRRGINPHKGVLALPGGFVEFGELAEHAVLREIHEEMNITSHGPTFNHTFADDQGHFLLFFVAMPLAIEEVERVYRSTSECTEMVIAYESTQLAFQSHTEALARYFNEYL
jgi:8-oxo-dGTP diphosphatase